MPRVNIAALQISDFDEVDEQLEEEREGEEENAFGGLEEEEPILVDEEIGNDASVHVSSGT